MNDSVKQYDSIDSFLANSIGSTFLLECMYLYLGTPIAIIGLALNILSFIIFTIILSFICRLLAR
jgi:hypothetical protein